ncbi:MAG: host attachment protein [Steroidobacteraceae bacterium]
MKVPETPLVTHVLVADSGMARLLRVTGPLRHRVAQQEELFERPSAHLPAHALTTDRTGRVFESSGRAGTNATHTRHGAASDYDPHTVEIERFAARIVQRLQDLHRNDELHAWVLIAAPRFLGVLRAQLPTDLHRTIVHEVAGDYVRADPTRILELIDSGKT